MSLTLTPVTPGTLTLTPVSTVTGDRINCSSYVFCSATLLCEGDIGLNLIPIVAS